jgi:hypothetical protein
LLNKIPESNNIVLDYFDPSSECVVENQAPTFDNEDLSWMDLDPFPQPKALNIGQVPLPPGLGESSRNPIVESSHVEDGECWNTFKVISLKALSYPFTLSQKSVSK